MNGPTGAADWLREIGEAADELGYGILSIEPGRIDLIPLGERGDHHRVTIETYFLTGNYLRRTLVPQPKMAPEPPSVFRP